MELNENARIDTSQVDDRRGSGGGGGGLGIPIPTGGGGRGGLISLVIAVLVALVGGGFGLNAATNGGGSEQGDNTSLEQKCAAENALDQLDCRNTLYVNSIQAYWQNALPERFGERYAPADTVFFSQAVSTGCGNADSGVGPFYCPADRQVYIDLTFYQVLAEQLGASGEFAQPYVLAHEYGHHVQTLLGTEAQMRRQQQRDPDNANALSVKLELQADCYAGAWAKNATGTADAGGQRIFTSITEQDISQAIDAAEKIGDDAISERANRPVNPDEFTHGSSAQRREWFTRGYDSGDPKQCDTFSGGV
ncbi:neutral zinc metallopeptidase [Micromonospora sp. WMMD882]|uniref:KPN_02809 family neutral zinc metallopeptidase n=1 Tax=Micromonospora sp. WMMD882 TaxID=3015151 RepID=UPI00248CBCF4|nr:neutral zinc metallopeptidase [Micromonospora sp. WMMD882]WBB80157.1 neutral zinc metallopeptidase [Micromonospora sp. WMMD882]